MKIITNANKNKNKNKNKIMETSFIMCNCKISMIINDDKFSNNIIKTMIHNNDNTQPLQKRTVNAKQTLFFFLWQDINKHLKATNSMTLFCRKTYQQLPLKISSNVVRILLAFFFA